MLIVVELRELPDREGRRKSSFLAGRNMVAMKATNNREESVPAVLSPEPSEAENSHLQQDSTPTIQVRAPHWLMICFWVCIVIAVAAAARRFLALVRPSGTGSLNSELDATFASRTTLTLAHIIPATAFVVLAPFVLFRPSGNRWLERVLLLLGSMVGISAYAMSIDAIGGWTERTAVLVFNSLFLFSMIRSFMYGQAGAVISKRRWLVRAVGILLGIATTRPLVGIFFATSRFTHLAPNQFFGIAFWMGFSVNTIVVEMWLRSGNHITDQYRIQPQMLAIGSYPFSAAADAAQLLADRLSAPSRFWASAGSPTASLRSAKRCRLRVRPKVQIVKRG
jgi:hypothetical protein